MSTQYWICQFDAQTWQEFVGAGAEVAGFVETRAVTVGKIVAGDWIIAYLRGASRLIGALEVREPMFRDTSPIWTADEFPVRVRVRPHVCLTVSTAVPIVELRDRLSLFQNLSRPTAWAGPFRSPLFRLKPDDGMIVIEALEAAVRNPVERPVDPARLYRRPIGLPSRVGLVTVPEGDPVEQGQHVAAQALLLELGHAMGYDCWVARNDRGRMHKGQRLADLPGVRDSLPLNLDEALLRTIGYIDCCWLSGRSVVAAFEIEISTTIFSGALRLADMIAIAPNLHLQAYIVAPEDRKDAIELHVNRPTFAALRPRLVEIVRFIPLERLRQQVERAGSLIRFLRPEFLLEISLSCEVAIAEKRGFATASQTTDAR